MISFQIKPPWSRKGERGRGREATRERVKVCRDRRHIGRGMGKIHEEEQRWETVTRESRRKRISSLLARREGKGEGVRDIFIWHATRLHPSFINWRSQEWAWQTAPGQTHTYVLCLSPPRPRSLNPSVLDYPLPPLFSAYASRGNGKWGFAISLTFEHSSLSRSRPQREIYPSLSLFLILQHFRLLPLARSLTGPAKVLPSILPYRFRYEPDLLSIPFVLFGWI